MATYSSATPSSGDTPFTLGNPVLPDADEIENPATRQAGEPDLSVIAQHIQARFTVWRNARTQLERKWLAYYRQWRCVQDSEDQTRTSERSKLKMPKTKEAVTNYVTSMLQILFAVDPYFELAPSHPEDTRPGYLRDYIRWIHSRENWRNKIKLHLTEQGIYGTGFLRQRAITETKEKVVTTKVPRQSFDAVNNAMVEEMVSQDERLETDYTRPASESVSIFNLYVNPTATNLQNAEGVIIRNMRNRSDLERMLAEGVIEVLPEMLKEHWSGPTIEATDTLQRRLSSIGVQTSSETDQIEVFEAMIWCPPEVLKNAGLQPDDDEEDKNVGKANNGSKPYGGKELHVIMANGTVLNPSSIEPAYGYNERPILMDWFEQVPGEFYGLGIAEISQGPQSALDATIRSRLDNKAISINQVFAADRRKLTSGQDLSVYPGKIFLTEGAPADIIMPLNIPDVTSGSYAEAQEYERYIDSAHGIRPVVGGAAKKGEQTATEASNSLGQAMGIVREMAANYEKNIMVKSYCWYARIISMYPNPDELALVIDPMNGVPAVLHVPTGIFSSRLPPGSTSLMGTDEPEFIPMGLISMQKRDIAGKIMNFLAATANPIDAPLVNRQYLLQEAWKSLGTGLDGQKVILTPQQAPQQAMMQQVPGMLQGLLGGAGGGQGAPSAPAPENPSAQPGEMLPISAPGGTPRAG